MSRTEKDRMSDFATWTDLEALKRNLEFTKDELLRKQEQAGTADEKLRARDEIATELERMSLLSEDIGKRMKAQELASDGAGSGAQPGALDGCAGEAPERRQESRRDHEADRRAVQDPRRAAARRCRSWRSKCPTIS